MQSTGLLTLGMIAFALCILLCGAAAAADIDAALGETIPLSGYSYESRTVYLFLTGPNLPANGVTLNNIRQPGQTRVDVDSDHRWSYAWGTGVLGLDEGTYTVWITSEPVGRSQLTAGRYAVLSVRLQSPGIRLGENPAAPGAIAVQSSPGGASVVVDGEYRGKTPAVIENIVPGSHNVTLSLFRYRPLPLEVTVRAGSTTEVNATMTALAGQLSVSTSPAGARVFVDDRDAGISPVVLYDLSAGSHTVSAQLVGYAGTRQSVTIAEEPVALAITLEPAVSPTRAGSPGFSVLIAFIAIVLVALLSGRDP